MKSRIVSDLLQQKILLSFFITLVIVGFSACDILNLKDKVDPNGPSLQALSQNATKDEIANVATGIESGVRVDINLYMVDVGMIGREVYRFLASEPRFTGDLLGKENSVLDNNTFYITRPWRARYAVVRNTNILVESAQNSTELTDNEKNGAYGFAKTIQAYQLLLNLTLTYDNGIRTDVATDNLGPFVNRQTALGNIATLLDDGYSDLNNAGGAFAFPLSDGFAGFDTPATFKTFNRAIAARVAVYDAKYQDALTILNDSFIDPAGDLNTGVYSIFSTASGDQINPIYRNPDAQSGDSWVAHPSYITDLEAGDDRINKVFQRSQTATLDGLGGDYGFYVYKTQTDPYPLIRNEELILIRAESRIQTGDLPGAVSDLNIIRNAHNLPDYSGAQTESALIDEMLKQRRYSLFGEGHRWIDMRRYNRLNQLPIDRTGDNVWQQFPIPAPENA